MTKIRVPKIIQIYILKFDPIFPFQFFPGMQYGMMLYPGSNQGLDAQVPYGTPQYHIIGFGPPGGKDNLRWSGIKVFGNGLPRLFYSRLCRSTKTMGRGRVPITAFQGFLHSYYDFLPYLCSGGIIQINLFHGDLIEFKSFAQADKVCQKYLK